MRLQPYAGTQVISFNSTTIFLFICIQNATNFWESSSPHIFSSCRRDYGSRAFDEMSPWYSLNWFLSSSSSLNRPCPIARKPYCCSLSMSRIVVSPDCRLVSMSGIVVPLACLPQNVWILVNLGPRASTPEECPMWLAARIQTESPPDCLLGWENVPLSSARSDGDFGTASLHFDVQAATQFWVHMWRTHPVGDFETARTMKHWIVLLNLHAWRRCCLK